MKTIAMLTPAEEGRLFNEAMKGDGKAMQRLVRAHEPLFRGVARKWKKQDDEDFMSTMRLCFIENLPRFEPDRGFRINTFIRWHLNERASDYIRRNRSLVVPGESQPMRRMRAANNEIGWIGRDQGRECTNADIEAICRRHQVNRADLERYMAVQAGATHIDNLSEENPHLQRPASQEDDVYKMQQRAMMMEAIESLNEREQRIIMTRHYTDEVDTTLEDLSNEFGVSRERIRQVEIKALEKLKAIMTRKLQKRIYENLNDNTARADAA